MKAIFPGSFNPFTKGHLDILSRALQMFEHVVVAIGYNEKKGQSEESAANLQHLKGLLANCSRVSVIRYSDLTVDAARRHGAGVIVRGFRNSIDAEYERQLAATNYRISDGKIDTVLIASRPEYEIISSSMVRELSHFGHPTGEYLPTEEECFMACEAVAI
ncbi:MAG: pantetheine-phosphate adenylyltransferase [Muribaculaceae bacterium]|nr:pantetheine-phosphate adenylyltransferase [Muribaculaceae bacterium]